MKKIYTMIAAILFISGSVFAQNASQEINKFSAKSYDSKTVAYPDQFKNAITKHMKTKESTAKTYGFRWMNYAAEYNSNLNVSKWNANFLFPDSTLLHKFGDSYSEPWIHAIATTLDPASAYFSLTPGALLFPKESKYQLDSVGFYFSYIRGLDDVNIVDTLIFEIVTNNPVGEWSDWTFTGDSFAFKMFEYDVSKADNPLKTTNNNPAAITTYKYPLTVADTNNLYLVPSLTDLGAHYCQFALPTPIEVAAGERIGISVKFKPGYTWTANVDKAEDKNSCMFISFEENGEDTDPTKTHGDMNISYCLTNQGKYDASNANWYGKAYWYELFTSSWAFEHHMIMFGIARLDVGVDEITDNGLTLHNSYPNPAENYCNIDYTLTNNETVNIIIYDIAGRVIARYNEGEKMAGTHKAELNTSSIPAGTYFYSLSTDSSKLTGKMTIIK